MVDSDADVGAGEGYNVCANRTDFFAFCAATTRGSGSGSESEEAGREIEVHEGSSLSFEGVLPIMILSNAASFWGELVGGLALMTETDGRVSLK